MQRATGELPSAVNWNALSERGLETLRTVALPIACGLTYQEVAAQRGMTNKAVAKALDVLAAEITRQLGAEATP